jgi:putative transposase
MARRPRLRIAGVPEHIVQRGNNRQATFFAEADYLFYLECLRESARRHDCLIHAYVLMTNHVHLLVTPQHPEATSLTMRDLGRRYVQYVNWRYRRTGTLWEGRHKSNPVDTQRYFLTCCHYIELNPVRARMVALPEDYRWSSHRFHALGSEDEMLSPHEEYLALGADALERQRVYRALFAAQLDEKAIREIRDAVNCGWPIGSERFKDQIEAALSQAARPPRRGRPLKSRQDDESGQKSDVREM